MNNLESDDEAVDTPLVSPFPYSDDDSDDEEVLNELRFRKFTAYLNPFLPMNIILRKAYTTIMVDGLEGTGRNLVSIIKDVYVFVGISHLEELYVTWAHLEKKRTRLRTYTNISQDNVLSSWRQRHRFQLERHKRRSEDGHSCWTIALRGVLKNNCYYFAIQTNETICIPRVDDEAVDITSWSLPFLLRFRKFTAYLNPFLPMNIILRKAYTTIMVDGLEGTGRNLVSIIKDVYVFVGRKSHLLEDKQIPSVGIFVELETASQIQRDAVTMKTKTASQDLTMVSEHTTQPIIVGIKRLHVDLEVTAGKVCVTAAKPKSVCYKEMDQDLAYMVATSKVPMLKPENGNAPLITKVVKGVETIIAPTTIKEKAVEKRFGGNAATKKTQRNLLKQQPKEVVNAFKGNNVNAVKASTCWVWKLKTKVLDHGNPQMDLQDKGVIDSGCSRHMTENTSFLTDYKEIDEGYFAFGGNPKGGKITGKGSGPNWLFDIDIADPPFPQISESSHDAGFKPSSDDGKKVDEDSRNNKGIDQGKEDNVNITNNINAANTNKVDVICGKTRIELPDDLNMPLLEDIIYSDDDEDVGVEADMNNLDAP
ncbi:hypothetical protein Tco_1548802 [Tanacetum coccineum]